MKNIDLNFKILNNLLKDIKPITLKEMSGIRLMNRRDTKFLTNFPMLLKLIEEMKEEYYVQETNGDRLIPYNTVYYDTKDKIMYRTHVHGRLIRSKVRVRTYINSKLSFLEVKNKNNKGFTNKKRVRVDSFGDDVTDEETNFLENVSGFSSEDLLQQLENSFYRITFVNKAKTERVTIDTFLKFNNIAVKNKTSLPDLVVIELKRDGNIYSPLVQILNKLRIKSSGFSKYCMGMAMTDINNQSNLLKGRLKLVEKLITAAKTSQ